MTENQFSLRDLMVAVALVAVASLAARDALAMLAVPVILFAAVGVLTHEV
jgi:hypothetical protein